jgi:hypothetical protein
MPREQARAVRLKFDAGARVRVKLGVKDPDFPDNDLGDFKGTISQVEQGKTANYLVQWSPTTLARLRPACRDFCKIEDVAFDKMWLLEEDLDRDPTAPLARKRCAGVVADPVSC